MASISKGAKKGSSKNKWDTEDVIQAVVIADSFNYRFLPLTTEKPRALLPLVNRPLIDYTIEFLAASGVQEVFVYCCAHADSIRKHFDNSIWVKPSSPIRLHIIVSENCPSVGDALRDIDSQAVIKSDFVLVSGDLVSNMDLDEVITKHKKLRETDKMTVMTNVYKKAAPGHRTRSVEDDILIVTESNTSRLLFCEKPKGKKKMAIPTTIFEDHSQVDIHYDVLDCHISVCSPSVPQLFSDNFDYQTRYHFIRGIIVNEEVLGNYIYAHFISDQYAARVSNLQTYEAVSKDVMYRWVYPLVPDNNSTVEPYSYGRHNLYLSDDITLGMDAILVQDVAIGLGTIVGRSTVISHSSIGRRCNIGEGVVIDGCYIWNDVTIGDNCRLSNSIIADGVELQEGVVIEPGCILSFNVTIGKGFHVKNCTRLTTNTKSLITAVDDWGDEEKEEGEVSTIIATSPPLEYRESEVGQGGKGFQWEPPQPDSDDESGIFLYEKWHSSLTDKDQGEEEREEEESSDSERSNSPSHAAPFQMEIDNEDMFYMETLDYIRSGLTDKVITENTILMINASKHAYNIPIRDVPLNIVRALVEGPPMQTSELTLSLFMDYVIKCIQYHCSLLLHYMKEVNLQEAAIGIIVESAVKNSLLRSGFAKIILEFYNLDVIEEMAINSWHRQYKAGTSDPFKDEILKCIDPVIKWLENAEEESEDDDN